MKVIGTILILFIQIYSISQITKKVCFIGNSYIYTNDLPGIISNIAIADGNTLIKDQNTIGGYTFQSHSTNTTTLAKIASNNWDYVVLQEQSQLPSFPWSQVQTDVLPFAQSLCNSIRNSNSCAIPVFFDTWGRQNGDPQWDSIDTFTEMNQRLYNAYDYMASENSGLLSPVGIAFEHIYNNDSGAVTFAQLYSGDGSHPSVFGSYLAACIFYQQLFQVDVIGNTYTPAGISALQRDYLQFVANHSLTMNDSININNIEPIAQFNYTISGLNVNFINTSLHDFEWTWDFGDGNTSILENPSHTYSSLGSYNVELIVSYCGQSDTISYQITLSNSEINEEIQQIKVFPNPSINGKFIIESCELIAPILIYDSAGKIVETIENNQSIIYLELPPGIYFVNVNNKTLKLISL